MLSMTQTKSVPLPDRACDCHMHVFDCAYPTAGNAILLPPAASIQSYAQMQSRLGFERHVLVQPSAYGTDNSLLLHTLQTRPSSARGVAVVDSNISDRSLSKLENSGVVGIRFNQVQIGATTMEMFDLLALKMRELGWHVQLHLPPSDLIAQEHRLASSPSAVVLDHFARICSEQALAGSVFQTLDRLLSNGNTWLKLSAPYLAGGEGSAELADFTNKLIRKYPDRMLWGTDWPHVTEKTKPDEAKSLSWLQKVISDPEIELAIFSRNPTLLYHFDE